MAYITCNQRRWRGDDSTTKRKALTLGRFQVCRRHDEHETVTFGFPPIRFRPVDDDKRIAFDKRKLVRVRTVVGV